MWTIMAVLGVLKYQVYKVNSFKLTWTATPLAETYEVFIDRNSDTNQTVQI